MLTNFCRIKQILACKSNTYLVNVFIFKLNMSYNIMYEIEYVLSNFKQIIINDCTNIIYDTNNNNNNQLSVK